MIKLPFADRTEAGRLLAVELSRRNADANAVVLAIPRGGVPVAFAIAHALHLPLDVVIARKLGVPWQPELAMGAIAGEARVMDRRAIAELGISEAAVERIVASEQSEMRRREDLYRVGGPAPDLHGRTAILVDDGLATGSTMLAAARYIHSMKPAHVVIAVPVGSAHACHRLRSEADAVVCLATPKSFTAVGEWYLDFREVSDDEVRYLLKENISWLEKSETPLIPA
jgi:putative phosphoribosyl transferase